MLHASVEDCLCGVCTEDLMCIVISLKEKDNLRCKGTKGQIFQKAISATFLMQNRAFLFLIGRLATLRFT